MLIALKIDVTKLDKSRFFKGKTGAVYADLIVNLKDDLAPDEYGNCGFISQSVTKEERLTGTRLPICGNAKLLAGAKAAATPTTAKTAALQAPKNDFADDDSVPF
jgi:nucleoside-triphosphatase THEP1